MNVWIPALRCAPAGMTVMQKFPLSKCHSSLIRLYTRPGWDHTLMS